MTDLLTLLLSTPVVTGLVVCYVGRCLCKCLTTLCVNAYAPDKVRADAQLVEAQAKLLTAECPDRRP